MSSPTPIRFAETDLDAIAEATGRVAVIVPPEGKLDPAARRVNKLTRGALARLVESARFAKAKPGQVISLAWPGGMAAEAVDVLVLPRRPQASEARKA
ncbi:leucyl aminopeptidase, partial [Cribrihabitans sp. XS_ASV171]